MRRFVGRKSELAGLQQLLAKKASSLIVIKGRRRIGKSRLAEQFAESFSRSVLLTGVPPEKGVTAKHQRDEFTRQMRRMQIPVFSPDDWGDLFTDLAIHCKKGRVLVILDEITWMGSLDPTFLPKLKTIWDTHFKKNPKLMLIISGSNSMWIDDNILSGTGFVGRISHQVTLKELPLHSCNEFWGTNRDKISSYEKFQVLSVTGGVPRYLEEIRPNLSAEQNLVALAYRSSGILFNEFEQIFSDLFTKRSRTYKQIVLQMITTNPTMEEIAKGLKRSKGGDLSVYLEDLEKAGFIRRDEGWLIAKQRQQRLGHYRICDNYVRFYLKYIRPHRRRIESDQMTTLPRGWKSIMGLQFENLVSNNALSLYHALGLSPDEIIWSGPYVQTANSRRQRCQVDYLIQTKHRVLYLCEVKFSEREVPFRVIQQAQERARRMKVPRGFSVRHCLIHVNGVSERLEQDEFFAHIVDFGTFLAAPAHPL